MSNEAGLHEATELITQRLLALVEPVHIYRWISDEASLAQLSISKAGGMPYAEAGDEWVRCHECGGNTDFQCQLLHADGGLITVYQCADPRCLELTSRAYPEPGASKAAPLERPGPPPDYPSRLKPARLVPVRVRTSVPRYADELAEFDPASADAFAGMDWSQKDKVMWAAVSRAELVVQGLAHTYSDDEHVFAGGWPVWTQGHYRAPCSVCGRRMRHEFSIESARGFLEWPGMAYVARCPEHRDQSDAHAQD